MEDPPKNPDAAPLIALVDCNNFYASCERVFEPKLRGVPVVVLSNNDGCVIARSGEAKKIGIVMGEPFFKCRHLVEKHRVRVFSANFALYGDMSRRVMTVLERFSPSLEIYSIDEAFLRLDGIAAVPEEYARQIRATVSKWTGIPISVGIAPTKTLAKAANRYAKIHPESDHVTDLSRAKDVDACLAAVTIEDVWGVGRQYAQMLRRNGITTALALKNADRSWIRRRMTVMGERTVLELRGVPCLTLDESHAPRKSVICSRSFAEKVFRKEDLHEALSSFAARAAEKLRGQGSVAGRLEVFIRTSPFQDDFFSDGAGLSLPQTSDTRHLTAAVGRLLDRIFKPGFGYKKAGVVLSDLSPTDQSQGELFGPLMGPDHPGLMRALDRINATWGGGTIALAAEGLHKTWRINRGNLSNRYTTQWDELPRCRA